MRVSQILLATVKEVPSDAEVISHKLMIRAGMVRKLSAGLYNWLPMGLRVLRKIENIVREEMEQAGAQELLMPTVQPAELWQESTRWEQYGPELLRMRDRHQREFCFGPTHEEVITDLFRKEVRSYKQLPINFFQIQTKFRDEIRPRFGVMRSREFIMKDAYSFHIDNESLNNTYAIMHKAYCSIFDRIGLNYRPVSADAGSIGGNLSHEFHVLAESGEDDIAFSDKSDFAANIELAEAIAPSTQRAQPSQELKTVDTPNQNSIEEVSTLLKISSSQCVKTLLVEGIDDSIVALVVRGDHEINEIKAEKIEAVASPFTLIEAEKIRTVVDCDAGSIGPVGLNIETFVDHSAAAVADFVCGANENGKHFTGVNWLRDLSIDNCVDIRNVIDGDPSPDGKGTLSIKRGIEVGHIFQLGNKYSDAMKATVLNEQGKAVTVTMGCYGIGITRIIAAAIEQNYDDNGIIWPTSIAPFQIVLIPMNLHKSELVQTEAEVMYSTLKQQGYDVLLDDRKERAGVMFADMELIGIPHRIVISERGLKNGTFEYKGRKDSESQDISTDNIFDFINEKFSV